METVEIPSEIAEHIADFSRRTGESRADVIRQALLTYLEDREDAMIAAERLKTPGKRIPLEEVARKYGLVD